MDLALDRLVEPQLRVFDTAAWGHDALATLDRSDAHVAMLGYLDLALSLRTWLALGGRHQPLNLRVSAALERRFDNTPERLLETYPGEIFPVDNAAAIAGIGLHASALGKPRPPAVKLWIERMQRDIIDPKSGLLRQSVAADGRQVDEGRGSGTALAAYFMSFTDEPFARSLYQALRTELLEQPLGFGAVQEYPASRWRMGDVDSGPLLVGYSVSATGFAMGAARALGDRESFVAMAATVHLVGGPQWRDEQQRFAAGGALGDALMLALLTAQPASSWRRPTAEGAR